MPKGKDHSVLGIGKACSSGIYESLLGIGLQNIVFISQISGARHNSKTENGVSNTLVLGKSHHMPLRQTSSSSIRKTSPGSSLTIFLAKPFSATLYFPLLLGAYIWSPTNLASLRFTPLCLVFESSHCSAWLAIIMNEVTTAHDRTGRMGRGPEGKKGNE